MGKVLATDNMTDIESAMNFLQVIGVAETHGHGETQEKSNGPALYISMAENLVEKMTNPFAKKLVKEKIDELKNI